MEMDIDEGETRPNKPNLDKIKERLIHKRMAERFTDYEGVMSDPNLTLTEKIIYLQKAINDGTRRKIYFACCRGNCCKVALIDRRKPTRKFWRRLILRQSGCNVYVSCTNWSLTITNFNTVRFLFVLFITTLR